MTTPTQNEQTAQNSAPEPLAGYAPAFDGTLIKKSCETCAFIYDDSGEYSLVRVDRCDEAPGLENLKTFPFKNGCKLFELHHTYTVDWEAEAKRSEAESNVCRNLSTGYCYSHDWRNCTSVIVVDDLTRACEKAL